MNIVKIVTILNWVVISIIGLLLAAETLFPAKGGDAAGKGLGQAFYYLAIIALIILLTLNLLPYNWAKYAAFSLVVLPFLYIKIVPIWHNWTRNLGYITEENKFIFIDKERDGLARAIRDGKPEKVKDLLQTPIPQLNEGGELLDYAITEAIGTSYKPQEKLECIRLLFQAGAQLDSIGSRDVPIHMAAAESGSAALLRLLLEQGADANAYQPYFKRAIIFEAIACYQEPEQSVQALLDFGANPNVTAIFDDEVGPVSPLWRAADMGRWGVCVALLKKGENPDFKASDGRSWRKFVEAAEQDFSPNGYSTQEDFERLMNTLKSLKH